MDPKFLRYYNQELNHVREMGSEFAREFPKIAGRLGMEGIDCADPYVERLLEGFAFMAARVQLKVDAEFPQFTQHLFELIYPHYLAPTPSMAVVNLISETNMQKTCQIKTEYQWGNRVRPTKRLVKLARTLRDQTCRDSL